MTRLILCVIATLLFSPPSDSLTLQPAALQELCAHANRILRGTCLAVESRRDPLKNRSYVYTTFRVDEALAGTRSETVVIRVIDLGETFARANGLPIFKPGDQELLFLTAPNEDGYPYLVGIGMGCYHIRGSRAMQHTAVFGGRPAASGPSGRELPRTYLPESDLGQLQAAIRETAPNP